MERISNCHCGQCGTIGGLEVEQLDNHLRFRMVILSRGSMETFKTLLVLWLGVTFEILSGLPSPDISFLTLSPTSHLAALSKISLCSLPQ